MMPGRKLVISLWMELVPGLWIAREEALGERWLGSPLVLLLALVMTEESWGAL